jgi:hypothetical protein
LPSETGMGVPQEGRANTGDERECSVHTSRRDPRFRRSLEAIPDKHGLWAKAIFDYVGSALSELTTPELAASVGIRPRQIAAVFVFLHNAYFRA